MTRQSPASERVLNIYRIKEYPQLQKSIEIKNDIDRVFFNKDYIGIVEKILNLPITTGL